MGFHRRSTPTYFGGLPAGYDYINNPALNGDPGAPAPADGKKAAGVNQGTYFVAFGEDATSSNTNRGLEALADNTDLFDNLFRTSQVYVSKVDATAAGATSSVVLTGDVYVGGSLETPAIVNDQETRNRLIKVVYAANDNEIEVSGVRVVATLIHDGANNNQVGVPATGFFTNPTITLSPAIPDTTQYRIYFLLRRSLYDIITLSPGRFFMEQLKTIESVPASVQTALRTLHAASGQAWDAGWDSTIRALAASGLNERYRRKKGEPASFNFDTPGDGAVIDRDGRAPESTTIGSPNVSLLDPINALWISRAGGDRGNGSTPTGAGAGVTGYVAYESRRSVAGAANPEGGAVLSAANFISVWPHDFTSAITNVKTQVTPALIGMVNPAGAGSNRVQLNAADFWFNGSSKGAVAIGYDLVEITYVSTGIKATYLITGIVDNRTVTVMTVDGTTNVSFAPNTQVRIRWLSMGFVQGAAAAPSFGGFGSGKSQWTNLIVARPPLLTTDATTEDLSGPPRFFAPSTTVVTGTTGRTTDGWGFRAPSAFEWGGFSDTFLTYLITGRLNGDGSVECTLVSHTRISDVVSGTTSRTWNPRAAGVYEINFTATGTHTITLDSSYTPGNYGDDEFYVLVKTAATGPFTITWPGVFQFSGSDATPSVNGITKYHFVWCNMNSTFLATKTVY